MQKITYKDIIHYKKHILVREQKLKEDKAKYSLTSQKVNQPHDKTIKIILDNKEEAVYLINKVLKLSEKEIEIKTEDIEKYNRKFITGTFENNEADIIYKMKNKNIFFFNITPK